MRQDLARCKRHWSRQLILRRLLGIWSKSRELAADCDVEPIVTGAASY